MCECAIIEDIDGFVFLWLCSLSDIKECNSTDACAVNEDCVEEIGTFHCNCKAGYHRNVTNSTECFGKRVGVKDVIVIAIGCFHDQI